MSGNPNNNANIGFVGEGNRNIDYLNDDNQNLGFVNEHNANIGFDERKHNIGVVNDGDHNIGVVSDSHGNTGFINEGPSRFAPAMPQPPVGADFDRVLASLHELHPDYFFNQGLDSVIEADDVFNVGPMFANVPQPKRSAEPTQETRQVRRRVQTTAAPPPFPALGNIPSGTAEASVKAPEPLRSVFSPTKKRRHRLEAWTNDPTRQYLERSGLLQDASRDPVGWSGPNSHSYTQRLLGQKRILQKTSRRERFPTRSPQRAQAGEGNP